MKKVVMKTVGSQESRSNNNNRNNNATNNNHDHDDNNNGNMVTIVNYKECLKNQAANIGKHAVDGCGEFLAGGPEGTAALTCAACGCNRSDHRREVTIVQA